MGTVSLTGISVLLDQIEFTCCRKVSIKISQAEQLLREELERLRSDNRQLLKENTALQCKLTEVKTLAKQQRLQKNKEIKQLKLK